MQQGIPKSTSNTLTSARRLASMFSVGLTLLLLVFFALHQRGNTGFFTNKFGTTEMLALYLPIVISMAAPLMRIMLGTLDPARLVEAFSDLCLAVGSLWLRHIFPFNFAHIADVFPTNIQVGFGWLNDGVGRLILLLQVIIAFISTFAALGSYLTENGIVSIRPSPTSKDDTKAR